LLIVGDFSELRDDVLDVSEGHCTEFDSLIINTDKEKLIKQAI